MADDHEKLFYDKLSLFIQLLDIKGHKVCATHVRCVNALRFWKWVDNAEPQQYVLIATGAIT